MVQSSKYTTNVLQMYSWNSLTVIWENTAGEFLRSNSITLYENDPNSKTKCSFLLILFCDKYLVVSWEAITKIIEFVSHDFIDDFSSEWCQEQISYCNLVQPSKVDTYSNFLQVVILGFITIKISHSNLSIGYIIPVASIVSISFWTIDWYLCANLYGRFLMGLTPWMMLIFISPYLAPTLLGLYSLMQKHLDILSVGWLILWFSCQTNSLLF
jgi:hypothetical protein